MTRTMWWVAGGLAVLLATAIVLMVVLLSTMQREAYQEAWEACLEQRGVSDRAVTADVDVTEWAAFAVEAAEACEIELR